MDFNKLLNGIYLGEERTTLSKPDFDAMHMLLGLTSVGKEKES